MARTRSKKRNRSAHARSGSGVKTGFRPTKPPTEKIELQFAGFWAFVYLMWRYPSGRLFLVLLSSSALAGFVFLVKTALSLIAIILKGS